MRAGAAGRTAAVNARWFAPNGTLSWAPSSAQAISDTAWTRLQNVVTVPAGVFEMAWEVDLFGPGAGNSFSVDAVQVERGATVTTYEASPNERAAADQRAGIYKLKLSVDPKSGGPGGVTTTLDRPCFDDSCPRTDWLTFDAGSVAEGVHVVTPRVEGHGGTDGVGALVGHRGRPQRALRLHDGDHGQGRDRRHVRAGM